MGLSCLANPSDFSHRTPPWPVLKHKKERCQSWPLHAHVREKKEEIKALILTNDNIIQKLFRSLLRFKCCFAAAFSKISSLYYLRLSGNVLIGLLGGHSCGTFQTNPIINRRFITRESSSKAVKAVNCYSYHLLKVDPSGSVTRVIEAECRQRAENKKPNRRRPTNERSSFDTEAFFFFLQN